MEHGCLSRHAVKDGGQVTGILFSVHFYPARPELVEACPEPVEGGG
jgi:hypothetical protein